MSADAHRFVAAVLLVALACACSDGEGAADAKGSEDIPVVKLSDRGAGTDRGPGTVNRPPVLKKVGDRRVVVGEPVVLVLEAFDPDGDDLTYAVFGKVPEGARFDKGEGRFEWTPEAMVPPVFLTFQVSDGRLNDRETARLTVSNTHENVAPVLEPVGDQVVQAGTVYTLDLQSNDENGDQLLFGVEGQLPEGASIDPKTGQFTWDVPLSYASRTVRVRFTVTDGEATDSMDVRFLVRAGGTGPSPPVFEPLDSFEAEVLVPLELKLVANDPDGDAIRYGIDGPVPEGATIDPDTGVFAWTPPAEVVGQAVAVRFLATDGTFTAYQEVKIFVFLPGPQVSCSDDRFEPDNSLTEAKPVEAGVHEDLWICDTVNAPIDVDWYAVEVPEGKELIATIRWPADGQPLDLALASVDAPGADPRFVEVGEGPPGERSAAFAPPGARTVYVHVFGTDVAKYAQPYTLEIVLADSGPACPPDSHEGSTRNDTPETASPVPVTIGQSSLPDLGVCPGDQDWFRFDLSCGQVVRIVVHFNPAVLDLDLYLYAIGDTERPIAQSISGASPESVTLSPVERSGAYLARVGAFPASASGHYALELEVDPEASCTEDSREPDDNPQSAKMVSTDATYSGGRLCCSPDYFQVPLNAGQLLKVRTLFQLGNGTATLSFPDAATTVATESGKELTLQHTAGRDGTAFLRLEGGRVGVGYEVGFAIEDTGGSCTDMSCPEFEVCDPSEGCVDDFCTNEDDCPVGYRCLDTFCVNTCESAGDCRSDLDYACKHLLEGRYCGPTGETLMGRACVWMAMCAGEAGCLSGQAAGICSVAGCGQAGDCLDGTICVEAQGTTLCALPCEADGSCPAANGFVCTPATRADTSQAQVCLPGGGG